MSFGLNGTLDNQPDRDIPSVHPDILGAELLNEEVIDLVSKGLSYVAVVHKKSSSRAIDMLYTLLDALEIEQSGLVPLQPTLYQFYLPFWVKEYEYLDVFFRDNQADKSVGLEQFQNDARSLLYQIIVILKNNAPLVEVIHKLKTGYQALYRSVQLLHQLKPKFSNEAWRSIVNMEDILEELFYCTHQNFIKLAGLITLNEFLTKECGSIEFMKTITRN